MPTQELTWQATTAKNLLDARKKNGRLGNKKSRSGCITCRVRRVKCGEERPVCKRCKSTGRRCDGYPEDSALTTRKYSSLIGTQLSQSLGLAEGDKRAFDFFLSWTAPRLAGSLDKDFWCGYVLQIAQAEPLIRDSLLAISILYEHPQYMKSFHDVQSDHPDYPDGRIDQNHMNALQLYNRAIEAFKIRVEEGKATPLLATLSCLLFICIELIRDDVFAALSLFTRGTELMEQFEASMATEKEQGLITLIKLMFTRLGVLAATYGHPRPIDVTPESVIIGQQTIFANLCDARTALYDLMADTHAYIRDASAWKESLVVESPENGQSADESSKGYICVNMFDTVSNVKAGVGLKPKVRDAMSETGQAVLPGTINLKTGDGLSLHHEDNSVDALADILDQQRLYDLANDDSKQFQYPQDFTNLVEREISIQKRLGQWLDAFQWPRKQVEETAPEAVSHLLMYYHISTIWLSTRLNAAQEVFDDFTYHFREIIRHAEVYIRVKEIEQPMFTFEVGAVPPMYFTASKCRIPSLRRRALDLLKRAPGKECMWGARGTAELACRLITIEEEGLGLPIPDCTGRCADTVVEDSILPPEEKRVHNTEILRNKSTRSFDVRVTRYSNINGRLLRRFEDFPI